MVEINKEDVYKPLSPEGDLPLTREKESIDHVEKLDNLQTDLIHENLGKLDVTSEHKLDLEEVKAEVVEQVDVMEERRDVIEEILPDLNDIVANNCLDELKRLRLSYGFMRDIDEIKRLLTNSQKIFLEQKNGNAEIKEMKSKKFSEIFHEKLVAELFGSLEALDESGVSDQEVFAMLVFLAGIYEELEEEKKKKFILWIEEKIAFIKEGKLLEVYEIQIAEDGTITIKGSMGGQNVTVIYRPGKDVFDVEVSV